ncbi:MAG TPA: hypothetical protein VIE91_02820 [Methylophilaceae bacterium]
MKKLYIIMLSTFLFGCATVTKPVSLAPSFWENRQQSVGVAVTKSNHPEAFMTGNMGLLDIIINKGNAKNLIAHLEKLELPRLQQVSADFATQLQARGFNVKKIDQPIDPESMSKFSGQSSETIQYSQLDYRKYKEQGIDRLLVISVDRVGTTRNYYGFIPTNPPQANLLIKGQLIDLNTNQLLWFTTVTNNSPIPEPWDQAPTFENVTLSVNNNVEQGVEKFEQSFFSGPVQ